MPAKCETLARKRKLGGGGGGESYITKMNEKACAVLEEYQPQQEVQLRHFKVMQGDCLVTLQSLGDGVLDLIEDTDAVCN